MQRKHPTKSNMRRTDSTWIPKPKKPYIMKSLNRPQSESMDSTWIPKPTNTIHHEITQSTSIREYGFYTNPNDVTSPKVMNSLHWPQSESVDSTRILVSTKQKPRSKRNQITGNRNHSTEHKVRSTGVTRIPMQQNMKKWSDWYPNGSSKSTTHIVPRKLEKIGWHAKWGKNPKFWKTYKIKTHLTFGHKNPKNPKINEFEHCMQKRPT